MFCQKCGAELENNAKFCPKCGVSVSSSELPKLSGSVMKFLKNMTFVCIGLQGLLIILWFFPTFGVSFGSSSVSSKLSDDDTAFNFLMILLGIASIISLAVPILKNTLQKHRYYIMVKVSACIYFGLLLMTVIINIENAKNHFSSLFVTFLGYLYLAAGVAIFVITVIMSSKTKVKN